MPLSYGRTRRANGGGGGRGALVGIELRERVRRHATDGHARPDELARGGRLAQKVHLRHTRAIGTRQDLMSV